jgi:hypothetical protein
MPFSISAGAAALIGAGVSGAAAIGGALISSSGNQSAANTAAQGQQDATAEEIAYDQQAQDQMRQAATLGIGDIQQGVSNYTSTVTPLLTPAPVTLPTYRDETPQQQTGESDLIRNAGAVVAASGLRGAGRAGVGSILDQDRRYQEDTRASNDANTLAAKQTAVGVANTARTNLGNVQAQEGGSEANTELLVGNQLGTNSTLEGQQTGTGTANAANAEANAQSANGSVASSTLGNLAGTTSSLLGGNPNVPGLGSTSQQNYVDDGSGYFGDGSGGETA